MAKNYKQEIDLSRLPRGGGSGVSKNNVNWSKSIGEIVHFIYDNIEGDIEIIDYNKITQKLTIKYNEREYKIRITEFSGCKLGSVVGILTSEFKYKIGDVIKDKKRNINITDREYRPKEKVDKLNRKSILKEKWYRYTCNICEWTEGWIEESNLKNSKNGCSCCRGFIVVEGINDIPTTAPEIIKYFQGGYDEAKLYTKTGGGNPNNRGGYINPICPDCKQIKPKKININNIYKTKSIGCFCSDGKSYGEKLMFNSLFQLNINFETEYSPKWIGDKRYDFYFNVDNKEYIIEIDGSLGHGKRDNTMNGVTKKESKKIDDYKDQLADEHNIKVIRIDCEISELDFIKNNIIESKLNELFDLSNIDWLKAEEFALSNRVKEACDLWNNGVHNTKEIAKIMKISRTTATKYLKNGSTINWCNYNSKEQCLLHKKHKPIQIFKNDTILGIFKSSAELSRLSFELFGVNLKQSNISNSCLNKKAYKGYTFKHISKEEYEKIKEKEKNLKQVI